MDPTATTVSLDLPHDLAEAFECQALEEHRTGSDLFQRMFHAYQEAQKSHPRRQGEDANAWATRLIREAQGDPP
jgi:hypothetical protein